MNPNHPIAKSQFCGPYIQTFPPSGIVKMVDLKHEEIATKATKQAATNVRKLALRFSALCLASTYICKQKPIFPPADVFVYLESIPWLFSVFRFHLRVQDKLQVKRTIAHRFVKLKVAQCNLQDSILKMMIRFQGLLGR